MSVAISGQLDLVEEVLSLGANCNLKSCNDLMAIDWAKRFSKNEIVELLDCHQLVTENFFSIYFPLKLNNKYIDFRNTSAQLHLNEFVIEKEFINESYLKQLDDHIMLKAFYRHLSNSTSLIDYNLIVLTMKKIYLSQSEGSDFH